MNPPGAEENVALSRYTTLGTGGPARWFAKPETADAPGRAPALGRRMGRSGRAGRARARTCSSPTSGFPGLALKLAGDLAGRGGRGRPARGRRRRPARGLPPPRARSGARRVRVRVRDPRHGRGSGLDERGRVRERHVGRARARARRGRGRDALADAGGARAALPPLGARARPGRRPGGDSARAAARRGDQGDRRRDAGQAEGRAADEQADVRQRLQEPRPRAHSRADARGVRPARLRDRRRLHLAQARELHRERGRRAARPTRSR